MQRSYVESIILVWRGNKKSIYLCIDYAIGVFTYTTAPYTVLGFNSIAVKRQRDIEKYANMLLENGFVQNTIPD